MDAYLQRYVGKLRHRSLRLVLCQRKTAARHENIKEKVNVAHSECGAYNKLSLLIFLALIFTKNIYVSDYEP